MGRGSRSLNSKQLLFQGKLNKNSKETFEEEEQFERARELIIKEKNAPTEINNQGDKYWMNSQGEIHRDEDKPAIVRADGRQEWWRDDKRHRDNDQPAVVFTNGERWWYKNSRRHRDGDKPAVVRPNGTKEWYQDGKIHRDNDQPAKVYSDGSKEWWVDGKFIRKEK